jgi:hypothetical protein
MLPVVMAWEALESMPSCILWEDKIFADKLFSSFIARRTPTRSSPDSPLKTNIVIHLTNQEISIKLEHVIDYNYSKINI